MVCEEERRHLEEEQKREAQSRLEEEAWLQREREAQEKFRKQREKEEKLQREKEEREVWSASLGKIYCNFCPLSIVLVLPTVVCIIAINP